MGYKGNLCHRHRHMILPFRHVKADKDGKTYWDGDEDPDIIPFRSLNRSMNGPARKRVKEC